MYLNLLTVHSLFRWCVLISIITLLIRSFYALKINAYYTVYDKVIREITITILHIQMLLGLWLYFISPFVNQFFSNMSDGIHIREERFFSIEHSLMMIIAVVIATIGASKSKRRIDPKKKHKTIVTWFTLALFIILLNIPWEFSPLVNRPSFR